MRNQQQSTLSFILHQLHQFLLSNLLLLVVIFPALFRRNSTNNSSVANNDNALGLADAQSTPAPALPTSRAWPIIPVGENANITGSDFIFDANKTKMFVVNAQPCLKILGTNPFNPQVIATFNGATNCAAVTLTRDEKNAFIGINKNDGGVIAVNLETATPTLTSSVPGFNANAVALNSQNLYAASQGQNNPRIIVLSLDPKNIQFLKSIDYGWFNKPQINGIVYTNSFFRLTTLGDDQLVVASSGWVGTPGASLVSYEATLGIINLTESRMARSIAQSEINVNGISYISDIAPSGDGKSVTYGVTMIGGNSYPPGIYTVNTTNTTYSTSPLSITRRYLAGRGTGSAFLALAPLPGTNEEVLITGNDDGIHLINYWNYKKIIKTDPAFEMTALKTAKVTGVKMSADERFIYAMTDAGLKIFLLRMNLDLPDRNVLTLSSTYSDSTNFFNTNTNNKPTVLVSNVNGTYLYAQSNSGYGSCGVIQISNPGNPSQFQLQAKCNPAANNVYGSAITLSKNEKLLARTYAIPRSYSPSIPCIEVNSVTNPLVPNLIAQSQLSTRLYSFRSAVFSPDSQYLLVANQDNGARIFLSNATSGWTNPTIISLTNSTVINNMLFTRDGNTLFLACSNALLVVNASDKNNLQITTSIAVPGVTPGANGMTLSPDEKTLFIAQRQSEIGIYDVTDKNNPKQISTVVTNCDTSQLTLTEDGRYLWLSCSTGITERVMVIDVANPAPKIIFTLSTSNYLGSNSVGSMVLRKEGFVYLPSGPGTNDIVRIFDINKNAVAALPVIANQPTEGTLTLKTGELTTGKIFFFLNQADTAQTTAGPTFIRPTIQGIDGNNTWFKIYADGSFEATPPDNLVGQTITLHVNLGDQFGSDMTFIIAPGIGSTPQPSTPTPTTSQPTTLLPSPAPATATAIATNASTSETQRQTQTPAQTTTNAPAIVTNAPTPVPPQYTFPANPAPGATLPVNNLQIITTDAKLAVKSDAASVTFVALFRPDQDTLMSSSVSPGVIYSYGNGVLRLSGTLNAVNATLKTLRISSLDNHPEATVKVAVSSDGGNSWVFADATLSQFGNNHAPQISANATIPQDIIVTLGEPFSLSMNAFFTDIDHDKIQYVVSELNADGTESDMPSWILQRNGVISGASLSPGNTTLVIRATDGAKISSDKITTVIHYEYITPAISDALPTTLTCKAGQGAVFSLPISAFTGTGKLTVSATLADGTPLPRGLEFDAYRFQLSTRLGLEKYDVMITVRDAFGESATKIISVNSVDAAPVTNQTAVPEIKALAEKQTVVEFPQNTFQDPDGDPLTFTLSPQSPWAEFVKTESGKLLLTVIPPQSQLGQCVAFFLSGFDGFLSSSVNVSVCIPPHEKPVAHTALPNVTKATDEDIAYRILSDAFLSPGNYTIQYDATALNDDDRATGLPGFLKFDIDMLFGKATADDVGSYRIRITARDTLGGETIQIFTLTIELSKWEEIKNYAEWIGGAVGAVGSIMGAIAMLGPIISCLRGRIEKDNPFVWNAESQSYEYCIKQHKPGDNEVRYNIAIIGDKKINGCFRAATHVVRFFSFYLSSQIASQKLEMPKWIEFNPQTSTVSILPEEIPIDARPCMLQVLRIRSFVEYVDHHIIINPDNFRTMEMKSKMSRLEQPLLGVPAKQGESSNDDSSSVGLTNSSDDDTKNTITPPPPPPPPPKNNPLQGEAALGENRKKHFIQGFFNREEFEYRRFQEQKNSHKPVEINPNSRWLPKK